MNGVMKDLITLGPSEMKEVRRHLQIIFQDPFSSLDPACRFEMSLPSP